MEDKKKEKRNKIIGIILIILALLFMFPGCELLEAPAKEGGMITIRTYDQNGYLYVPPPPTIGDKISNLFNNLAGYLGG